MDGFVGDKTSSSKVVPQLTGYKSDIMNIFTQSQTVAIQLRSIPDSFAGCFILIPCFFLNIEPWTLVAFRAFFRC